MQMIRWMSRLITFLIFLVLIDGQTCPEGNHNWPNTSWTKVIGTDQPSGLNGCIGEQRKFRVTNYPPGRIDAASVVDIHGSLWMFGGMGQNGQLFNDLWELRGDYSIWAWQNPSNITPNHPGVYDVSLFRQPSYKNLPAARYGHSMWTDLNGKIYVYGGIGIGSQGVPVQLNDIWCWDPSAITWTWLNGDNTERAPNWGTLRVESGSNSPGSRAYAHSGRNAWDQYLILFGGLTTTSQSKAVLNDLWWFNLDTLNWTNIWTYGGDPSKPDPGSYSTQRDRYGHNWPASRSRGTMWIEQGFIFLFGGEYVNGNVDGMLNDVWMLQIFPFNFFNSTNNNQSIEWTWESGNGTLDSPGSWPDPYPSTNNIPRARSGSAVINIDLKAYIFGGRTKSANGDIVYMGDLLMLHYWDNLNWEIIAGSTVPSAPPAIGLPSARYGMVHGKNDAQKLIVMAGGSSDGINPIAETWIYTVGTGSDIDASNIRWSTSSIQTSIMSSSTGSSPSGTNPSGTNPSGTNPSGTNPSGSNPSGTNPSGSNPSGTASSHGTSQTLTTPFGIESRDSSKIPFWVWIIVAVGVVAIIVTIIIIVLIVRRNKSKDKAEPNQNLVEIGVTQASDGNAPPGKPAKDIYTTPGHPVTSGNSGSSGNSGTRKTENSYTTLSPTGSTSPPSNAYMTIAPVTQSTGLAKEYDMSSMKDLDFITSSEIKIGQSLGEGSFGIVYKGNWRGTNVALKNLKKSQMESLVAEASLMKAMNHPNVIRMFGVTVIQDDIFLVTEFCSNGSLSDYFIKHQLGSDEKLLTAVQVASGMCYLHGKKLIHRDLAVRNVLVTGEPNFKVADFGLSKISSNAYYQAKEDTAFPIRWTAPEVFTHARISIASDVWSFGVVLWEIWEEGKVPYFHLTNAQVMEGIVKGMRLDRPESMNDAVWAITTSCFHADPKLRPTMEEVSEKLQALAVDINPQVLRKMSSASPSAPAMSLEDAAYFTK